MRAGTELNNESTLILGHRGFKGPLENTLPAFRRALLYADGVEFDVRVTGDGKLVVHHDEGFWSDGLFYRINGLSLRELRSIHPLGKLIPRVKNIFRAFRNSFFDADVKEPEAVEPLLKLVERFSVAGRVVFSSENPGIVKALLRECPDCRVGFSIVGYSSLTWIPRIKGLYSLHVPIDAVSYIGYHTFVALLRALRKRGLRIYLWNYQMNELEWVPRLWRFADALILDNPAWVKKGFYGYGALSSGDTYDGLGIR
ncbi:glycerophosphodiester phosphodiesterase family protein [Thermococcus gorgonarius]|uniref:Glycerophosphodiester phosphodiesterase n=1 Tax=Thermococcus gorgonarius TaxID=71997 RepID=A0A2Z2M3Z4_THEGO|nr:glycerophosphodiester phosphodiesterase family protein [Thermococcus gorgonarius]ASJ00457.1 glycerophosphodiester phosphodiesterase [Thermococcus gorgonarius]